MSINRKIRKINAVKRFGWLQNDQRRWKYLHVPVSITDILAPQFERIHFVRLNFYPYYVNKISLCAHRVIVANRTLFAPTIMEWNVNKARFWEWEVIAFILPQANRLDGIHLKKKNADCFFSSLIFNSNERISRIEREKKMDGAKDVHVKLHFVILLIQYPTGVLSTSNLNSKPHPWCSRVLFCVSMLGIPSREGMYAHLEFPFYLNAKYAMRQAWSVCICNISAASHSFLLVGTLDTLRVLLPLMRFQWRVGFKFISKNNRIITITRAAKWLFKCRAIHVTQLNSNLLAVDEQTGTELNWY